MIAEARAIHLCIPSCRKCSLGKVVDEKTDEQAQSHHHSFAFGGPVIDVIALGKLLITPG